MPRMSKVELYTAIRRDARAGFSGRAIQRKHQVTWRTVSKALASAWPEPRKKYPPRASKSDSHKPVIDTILRADLDAPRKQRHTAKRIFDRLIEEHGMVDVSYQVVRAGAHPGRRLEVLLLHRHLAHDHVVAGLAAAVRTGALTADAVALEARKAADADDTTLLVDKPWVATTSAAPVASLTQRRLVQLPADSRPLPSVAVYDQLLRCSRASTHETSGP